MGNVGKDLAEEMRLEAEPQRVRKSLLLKSDKLELRSSGECGQGKRTGPHLRVTEGRLEH